MRNAPEPIHQQGQLKYELFPEVMNQLRVEIDHHPKLLEILHNQPDKNIYVAIQEIAAYCEILLNGDYDKDDILKLAEKLVWRLRAKRSILVLPQ